MSIVDQIHRAWFAVRASQEIARNSSDTVVERYARSRPNAHSPALFDDEGNARWITIGAEKGEDGKSHGGHHVQIDREGKMLTGQFAGQTLKQAFGDHSGDQKHGPSVTHEKKWDPVFFDRGKRAAAVGIKQPPPKLTPGTLPHRSWMAGNAESPSALEGPGKSVLQRALRDLAEKPQAFQPVFDDTNTPRKPSGGIVEPRTTIDNEEAKAGDQLGLFGEATKTPSKKPTMAGDPKAKAVGLFDTRGEADQMDFFGDGIMPEDLVYKPKNAEPVADESANKKPDEQVGESGPTTISLRDRKSLATRLANEGKAESEIFDHLSKRGVAIVDARKLAAAAIGGSPVPKPDSTSAPVEAKPVEEQPKPTVDEKPSEPAKPPVVDDVPAVKAANAHQQAIEKGDSPRQAAVAAQKEMDADYVFARSSSVRNAGEDLKGSARHKINAWKSLEQAEKDGTASELVARDHLLKNEPHQLMVHADRNPLTSLAMHFAMKSFPAKPGTKGAANAKKDREQYLEAYRSVKEKAEQLANTRECGQVMQAIGELQKHVIGLIKKYRGQTADGSMGEATAADKYNQTANDLVDLHKALDTTWRAKKTGVAARANEFAKLAREKYGDEASSVENLAEHAQDIMEGHSLNKTFGKESQAKKRFNPADVYVKHAKRSGGRDVAAIVSDPNKATKHMVESFGVRGVQWGNTVSDEERKHHAARTVEALTDLADITGLHPKDIALNGKLGLAIGARGKGNASAHYEPGTQVINLTRASGVGALAHEWGHAFDHMLNDFGTSRKDMNSSRSSGTYMSGDHEFTHHLVGPDGRKWSSKGDESRVREGWKLEERPKIGIRKAYAKWWDAAKNYRDRLRDELKMSVRNGEMSAAKASDYWNSNHEIFARAFERHVQHKLEKDGRENTYLSGFSGSSPLWPTKAESKEMEAAFDGIFEEYRKHAHGSPERIKYSRSAESALIFDELMERETNRYSEELFYDEAAEDRARELYQQVSASIERYEWNSALHPRVAAGRPTGGQFTTRQRELPEAPVRQDHHSLHLANVQDRKTYLEVSDWAKRIRGLVAVAGRAANSSDEEAVWAKVDKNQLRKLLDDMNKMDQDSKAKGGTRVSDIVNYNQLIPKMIAERLHGGSRFFDPTKLRGRWHEPEPPKQQPGTSGESSASNGGSPAVQPQAQQQPEPQAEAKPDLPPIPEPESALSKPKLAKLNNAIKSLVGDDPETIDDFRGIVLDAWKQRKQEAAEHNEAIRTITGTVSKLSQMAGSGQGGMVVPQALSALVRQARARTLDPAIKRGFDEMVDTAEKYFPHLIAGRGEDGLLDLLSEGVKPVPDVMDEDVVELAMSLAGPRFFASHDQGETFEDADSTNWDNVPFSWLAAKGQVEAIRYSIHALSLNLDSMQKPESIKEIAIPIASGSPSINIDDKIQKIEKKKLFQFNSRRS